MAHSTQDIMDLFVAKLNTQIDDEYFKEKAFKVIMQLKKLLRICFSFWLYNKKAGREEIKHEMDHMKLAFEGIESKENQTHFDYLKRLEGQFKFKLNSFYSSLMEKSKLTYEVNCWLILIFQKKINSISFIKFHKETNIKQLKLHGNLSCLNLYLIKNPAELEKV